MNPNEIAAFAAKQCPVGKRTGKSSVVFDVSDYQVVANMDCPHHREMVGEIFRVSIGSSWYYVKTAMMPRAISVRKGNEAELRATLSRALNPPAIFAEDRDGSISVRPDGTIGSAKWPYDLPIPSGILD